MNAFSAAAELLAICRLKLVQ